MLLGDRAQLLQIPHGRGIDADRAGHGLDDHRSDRRGIVEGDQLLERIRELGTVLGLAAAEAVLLEVQGMRQMVDTGQQRAEIHPVLDHAADGDPAEPDAVIAALPSDQARARALADGPLVGQRDLQRGVDQLGAGVGEEGVIEVAREQVGQLRCQQERFGMAPLEAGREVELGRLGSDRLDHTRCGVARIAAPQASRGIEQPAPVGHDVVHALGTADQARVRLEMPVGGERHPERFEVVRGRLVAGEHAGSLHERPSLSGCGARAVNAWARARKGQLDRCPGLHVAGRRHRFPSVPLRR